MTDSKRLLEELREQVPSNFLTLLQQLSTAEGNDASNIADDIRFGFDSQSLAPAPLVIRLVAAIASERPQLQQTRVFSIFSTLAGYVRPELPASLQASITRELRAVTAMLADLVEGDQATTEARQASLVILALFAPQTPMLEERMVEHILNLPDGAVDMDHFEFACAERLLSGSDAWRSLVRELAERYLADPDPSCLTPVELVALTRHLAFLWQEGASEQTSERIRSALTPCGPDLYQ